MTKLHRIVLLAVAGAWSLALPGVCALAEDAPRREARLTDAGRLLISGALGGYWAKEEDRPSQYSRRELRVSPAVVYFFRDRLGLGGYLDYGYKMASFTGYKLSDQELGAGVNGAYELRLAPRLGLLLLPQLGYLRRWRTVGEDTLVFVGNGADGRTTQQRSPLASPDLRGTFDQLRGSLFVPLVFHLTDSVAVGLGPYFLWDFYLSPRDRDGSRYHHLRAGASSWIGGSF